MTDFCECEWPPTVLPDKSGDPLTCRECGRPLICEFTYMEDTRCGGVAVHDHVGYLVCEFHLEAANNAASVYP